MQGGREETVSHVVLRRREMMVYLVGRDDPVRPDRLSLEPQWFTTERNPQALQWYLRPEVGRIGGWYAVSWSAVLSRGIDQAL